MHNKEIFEIYSSQTQTLHNSVRRQAARKQYITAFSKKELVTLIQDLTSIKPCELGEKFKEMIRILPQCSDHIDITDKDLKSITSILEEHNEGWLFTEHLCEKLDSDGFARLVDLKILDCMTREFFQDKPDISNACSIIAILGHMSPYVHFGTLKYLCRRMTEVALLHPKYLLKPLSFLFKKVFRICDIWDSNRESLVKDFLQIFIGLINHPDADYVNIGQGLSTVLKLCNADILSTFVNCNFLQQFVRIFDHVENIQAADQVQKMDYSVICFYTSALQIGHQPSLNHFDSHIVEIMKVFLNHMCRYLHMNQFRRNQYFFLSVLSTSDKYINLLSGLKIMEQMAMYCRAQASAGAGSEDTLYQLFYLIDTYTENVPLGQLQTQLDDSQILNSIAEWTLFSPKCTDFVLTKGLNVLTRISKESPYYKKEVINVLEKLILRHLGNSYLNTPIVRALQELNQF